MHVSSLVVHAVPEKAGVLQDRMLQLPGVEIHAATDDGRIVVTVEDTGEQKNLSETVMKIQTMEGVLSLSLAYDYCDNELTKEASQ